MKDMTYADAIERVMLDNGGYAPLSLLYRDVWKHKDRRKIKGLTPNDTIRRWVQTDTRSRFVRIGLGVYALESVYQAGKLPVASPAQPPKERRHSEIEGMLIEIGNLTPGVANTYTPDRSAVFQNKKLGNIATLEESPKFTYPEVVKVVKRVDVIWFNRFKEGSEDGYPTHAYEVEHSGRFDRALARLSMLLNFRTELYCIAESRRKREYERLIAMPVYQEVAAYCKFRTYEDVEADYKTRLRRLRL